MVAVRLGEAELGAALAVSRLSVGPHSPIAHVRPPANPRPVLARAGVLAEGGDALVPLVSGALRSVAQPDRVLSCVINVPGDARWQDLRLFRAGDGPLGALERHGDQLVLVPLADLNEAVEYVVRSIDATAPAARGDASAIDLGAIGYAALLAGADVLQTTALRARLGRAHFTKAVLTPALLETELDNALSYDDTRWAAVSGRRVCPVDLARAAGHMARGLDALQSAGLVRPVPRGQAFTEAGEHLTDALNDRTKTAGLTLSILRGATFVSVGSVSVFAGSDDLWIGTWSEASTDRANVRLIRTDAAGIREQVRHLLQLSDALPPTSRCPTCHTPVRAGARFCTSCGAKLAVPPPVAERRCPNPQCGKPAAEGKKFCTSCGTHIPI